MRRRQVVLLAAAVVAVGFCAGAMGQVTTVNGGSMALRSSGTPTGTMSGSGYVGTYLTVPAGGAVVNLAVSATGGTGSGAAPHLNLVIADSVTGFSVGNTSASTFTTGNIALPAGTYLVRTERDYGGNVGVSRSVTVNSVTVNTVSGGTVGFANSSNNTNALAAAETYIEHFRKGEAAVRIVGPGGVGLLPGTPVNVDLGRHAFNFGTAVTGFNGSTWLQNNPAVGSDQYRYQQALKANFNAVVPENAGKWASNSSGSVPTNNFNISYVNTLLNYAQQNNMRARMHNLIWGSQQPTWVNNLLSSDPTTLRNTYITNRIKYYVGDATDGNPNDDPANRYVELDVYNESVHTGVNVNPSYWNAYQASGIAGIYNEVAAAAASVGAGNVKLFTNEYNVVADSTDSYANWYKNNVEAIRSAGGAVSGVGFQYYANPQIGGGNSGHNPARIMQVLQNLSVEGLPIALTEFGVKPAATQTMAAQILSETVPLVFGTKDATGFFMWGFWRPEMWGGRPGDPTNNGAAGAAFYNADWTPTEVLTAWQGLMSRWDTNVATTVGADGKVHFRGFYGDYYMRGQTTGAFDLTVVKGVGEYQVAMAAPPTWSVWNAAASGAWGNAGNWGPGGVAEGVGRTAYFGPAAGARSVSVLPGGQTVGMIVLDSAAGSYAVGGTGVISMEGFDAAAGGGVSAIRVVAGSHAITAPLTFVDAAELSVAAGAALDIGSNALVLVTPADEIRAYLADGRVWSSVAAGMEARSLGYRDAGGGVTVVEIAITGDANMDGDLNGDDYALLDRGMALGLTDAWWYEGDFDYDGVVGVGDYLLLDEAVARLNGGQVSPALLAEREARFGQKYVEALVASVPEPRGMLIAVGAWLVACGRRQSREFA